MTFTQTENQKPESWIVKWKGQDISYDELRIIQQHYVCMLAGTIFHREVSHPSLMKWIVFRECWKWPRINPDLKHVMLMYLELFSTLLCSCCCWWRNGICVGCPRSRNLWDVNQEPFKADSKLWREESFNLPGAGVGIPRGVKHTTKSWLIVQHWLADKWTNTYDRTFYFSVNVSFCIND